MKNFQLFIILCGLIFSSCTVNQTEHDGDQAAELAKLQLLELFFAQDLHPLYQSTHQKLQEGMNFEKFEEFVTYYRGQIPKGKIEITGFETYHNQQAIAVFAHSPTAEPIYLKLSYIGTKSQSYALTGIHFNNVKFNHGKLYKKYLKPLLLQYE